MIGILFLPRRYASLGTQFAPSLFSSIGSLFLVTGFILQRVADLSSTGVAIVLILAALFLFTGGFLYLREKYHN
jgi:hypothetical protein